MRNYNTTKITNYLPVIFVVLMIVFSAFCWSKVLATSQGEKASFKELTEVKAAPSKTQGEGVIVLIGIFVVLSQYLSSK